jgi:hypothetical protein
MLAFIMEELRDWREGRMKRTTAVSAIALAAIGAVSLLQPLLIALAVTALFVGFGWAEGNRYQAATSSQRLLLAFPIRPRAVAGGKALSSLALWSIMAFFLSPILAASAMTWGLSADSVAGCLLCWLCAYYAATSAGFFSSLAFERSEGLLGFFFMLLWLFSPLFLARLGPGNPFIQAWDILKLEGGRAIYLGMAAEAVAASLLLAASAAILGRIRRKRNG